MFATEHVRSRTPFVVWSAERKRLLTSSGLLMAVLLLAGCGGGPKGSAATATRTPAPIQTTHAEFIRTLDATCRGTLDDLGEQADTAGNDTQKLAGITKSIAGRITQKLRRQERLDAPVDDRAGFQQYLNAQHRLAGVFLRMSAALDAGDVTQTRYLLSLVNDLRRARTRAALDLGLERCGG